MELLTAARMGEIETAAMEAGGVTGLELMERAGRGVVDAALAAAPARARAGGRAVILCGPGNNGGDGYVAARLLAARGWRPEVFALGDPAKLPPDAAENARRWREQGGIGALEDAAEAMPGAALVVDALFGAGLTRALEGAPAALAGVETDAFRVAVDAPSGLCMDSGRPLGPVIAADLTVTFHRARPGHYLAEGPDWCGDLRVVDIGLESEPADADLRRVGAPGARVLKGAGHKYAHGHAVVVSGPMARGGAARMAARGALRIGAGLVTVACPPSALIEHAGRLDAIMVRPAAGDGAALAELLADDRLNAVALGMGLGVDERARGLVEAALGAGRAAVLDADALTLFADDPAALFSRLNPGCVLTPHMGEFARVFPDIAERLRAEPEGGPAMSRADAAREAAARAGCAVLLKGPDTVVADPDGRASVAAAVYDRAAPWLATAGAGDVLSGMIAGLLARGLAAREAAETAAWLHAEAARSFGPGLIAEDIPEALPGVFRALAGRGGLRGRLAAP